MSPAFSTAGELYWGAIHAHSAISRCSSHASELSDMYIFARDAVGLDFLGITDHDNDLRLGAKVYTDEYKSTASSSN